MSKRKKRKKDRGSSGRYTPPKEKRDEASQRENPPAPTGMFVSENRDHFAAPQVCSACGLVAPSPFGGGSGTTITVIGSISQCPNCGEMAPVVDGTYFLREQAQRFVDNVPNGREILSEVADVYLDLETGEVDVDSAHDTVREIFHRLSRGEMPDWLNPYKWSIRDIAILLGALAWVLGASSGNVDDSQPKPAPLQLDGHNEDLRKVEPPLVEIDIEGQLNDLHKDSKHD